MGYHDHRGHVAKQDILIEPASETALAEGGVQCEVSQSPKSHVEFHELPINKMLDGSVVA